MPSEVQWRGGSTTQNNNFIGAEREVTVNEDTHSLRVHDGVTSGGFELARADLSNAVGIVSITAAGNITADSFVKSGGTSSQFLKADGSVDSTAYLPFGNITLDSVTDVGNVTTNGISVGVVTASSYVRVGGSSTQFLKADGSVDSTAYLPFGNITLDSVTDVGNVTTNGISVGVVTASSYVRVGGSSTQFLKADGSVDSTVYLSSYSETDTLSTVTSRGNVTTNGISVGVVTASNGNFSGIVTADTGFNIGISSAGSSITTGPLKTLNFIGVGNTFSVSGSRVDISVSGVTNISYASSTNTLSSSSGIGTVLPLATISNAGLMPATSFAAITYATDVELDMAALDGQVRTISLTGNLSLTSINRAVGRSVTLRIIADGTQRTLTFPSGWVFIGTKPANIAASKTGVLSLTFFGSASTDVVAAWGVQS